MSMMYAALVAGVLGIAGAASAVQEVPAAQLPPESATNPLLSSPGRNPFRDIFIRPGTQPDVSRPAAPSSDAQPRIVWE